MVGHGGPDEAQAQQSTDLLTKTLDYYQSVMSRQPYVAGEAGMAK
jgi:hypothetical protein